ncbi:putative l-rhamnonate dehydratase protein [Phaeoacremonium minimum UCRPA7]|uniref:Putative l-rhamnonate dehydratase protein n=1 Tax=Phaeoacremonium minimum (strain UCR-PA7) TaxID=1286976 RepID=R8BPK3_PHAM7|nr:putative l-rhamnonate dehydratase protein [Phaeoacremonium minimum UCRPA7]EOO01272.1 putative l-rhamnonate dehydratase protein [Phaeoacremonium minimum UCRPA7]
MAASKEYPRIVAVRTFLVAPDPRKSEADKPGHWLYYQEIANPMSKYSIYKDRRESWGVDVLKDFCVEIEASNGTKGFAIGHGGFVGCFLTEQHFKRFLIDADPRDTNLIWDQMYRGSQHYGRRGITMMIISVIDLALWDLLGKIRGEPVYKMIGGQTKDRLAAYCTGPNPDIAREQGFWGGKVPLPYSPSEPNSLQKNYDVLAAHRKKAGPEFPLMVDCYMSLNIPYAIKLINKCADLDIEWWEEVLSPDDHEGYGQLRQALPHVRWATGEHEYTRWGFRKLIENRLLDVLQPDVMWCGGMTELVRIATHAAAYDIDIVPHGTSHYTVHFCMSQQNAPLIEYVAYSPDGRNVGPVHGDFFIKEPLPTGGLVETKEFDKPGFGLEISPHVKLVPAEELLKPFYDIFGKQQRALSVHAN